MNLITQGFVKTTFSHIANADSSTVYLNYCTVIHTNTECD